MCISRRKWRLIMSTPDGKYSLNSHLKDSVLGFAHSAPTKNSEPPNKRKLEIGCSQFFVFGGDISLVPVLRTHAASDVYPSSNC